MKFKKYFLLFFILGAVFNFIEFIVRIPANQLNGMLVGDGVISFWSLAGYTSAWMWLIGGICGVFLGKLNEWVWSKNYLMWIQCLIGTAFIVLLEYGSGMVLNNVF